MQQIIAKDNETLDLICYRHYGREDVVPEVLKANPHLAYLPPYLTAGLAVNLPDIELPRVDDIIRLWS